MLKIGIKILALAFFVLALIGCASLLAPKVKTELLQLKAGQFTLDPAHVSLIFKVKHLELSTYVGRFNQLEASLDFDPENPLAMRLEALIETASVDVNDSELEVTLRDWLGSEQFPQARFSTQSVRKINPQQFELIGQLSLKGVTKPLNLTVTFHGGANNILTGKYTLGFSATTEFNRSDFGIDNYLGLVGDRVRIEIEGEFLKN